MWMRNQIKICMSSNQSFSRNREKFQNGDGLPLSEICVGQGSLEQQAGLQCGTSILILSSTGEAENLVLSGSTRLVV